MAAGFVSMTCAVFYIRGHYRAESAELWAVQLEGIHLPGAAGPPFVPCFPPSDDRTLCYPRQKFKTLSASAEIGASIRVV